MPLVTSYHKDRRFEFRSDQAARQRTGLLFWAPQTVQLTSLKLRLGALPPPTGGAANPEPTLSALLCAGPSVAPTASMPYWTPDMSACTPAAMVCTGVPSLDLGYSDCTLPLDGLALDDLLPRLNFAPNFNLAGEMKPKLFAVILGAPHTCLLP